MATKTGTSGNNGTVDPEPIRKVRRKPHEAITDRLRAWNAGPMNPSLAELVPAYRYTLDTHTMVANGSKPTLPAAKDLATDAIKVKIENLAKEIRKNGSSEQNREKLRALLQELLVQKARIDAVREFLDANPKLNLKDNKVVRKALASEETRYTGVIDTAMTTLLSRQRQSEQTVRSFDFLFRQSGLNGKARNIYWLKAEPVTTEEMAERGEVSLMEIDRSQFPGGELPIFEAAILPDGTPAPITFLDFNQKQVFHTMGTDIVYAAAIEGQLQGRWYAQIAQPARAVAHLNVGLDDIGPGPIDPESTPGKILDAYTSDEESFKALTTPGNHLVGRPRSRWEKQPVIIWSSFVQMGMTLLNEGRSDSTITEPAINPKKHRVDPSLHHGTVCPWLLDKRAVQNKMQVPLMITVSNERADGTWVVANNTNTSWSAGRHTVELEQGANFAAQLVTHLLLHQVGRPTTDREAQKAGQILNLALRQHASEKFENKVFLEARCEHEKSRTVRQTSKDGDGNEILDASGNPTFTGKYEQIHHIHIKFRDGIETFRVNFIS